MPTATITSKGQVTIPIAVRNDMDLCPGSKLEFISESGGAWRLVKRKHSIIELAGIIEWTKEPISIDEMNKEVKRQAARRFLESS